MYSISLKFRIMARAPAALARVYVSMSAFSAKAVTSPCTSTMLTVSPTVRTLIVTLAWGIISLLVFSPAVIRRSFGTA